MDPFVGEIKIFACNIAPRGWAFCNGQLLPISQNTALFSLLGTTYGGDGKATFALPDFQGRSGLQQGQGGGLSEYDLGQSAGEVAITLIATEMPSHTHGAKGHGSEGQLPLPKDNTWAGAGAERGQNCYNDLTTSPAVVPMSPTALSFTGGSQPHNNMMPYLTLNYCIAMQGIFPPRG